MSTSVHDATQTLGGNRFLDEVMKSLGVRNDQRLAFALGVRPATISKIRHNRSPVTPALLIYAHDATGISIRELRYFSGDTRPHTGKSATPVVVNAAQ